MVYINMVFKLNPYPSIHICSLAAAKEVDHSIYDGVITIEDSREEDPLRIPEHICDQLVLCFDDISQPVDDYILPSEKHINKALNFAAKISCGSLLVHCFAGVSRSSGIALAIIAKGLGPGKEKEALKELQKINPFCMPNKLIVWFTDEILERNQTLYKMTGTMMNMND